MPSTATHGDPTLKRPLAGAQVNMAVRAFERHLVGWQHADAALALARTNMPGHDAPEVLAKAALVNALYGTNVKAIV